MADHIEHPPATDPRRATVAPYGSWRSPVTAKLIAEGGVGINLPQGVGESLYWIELRPTEDGRYVVVRRAPDGSIADVTPEGRSARTLVHEYGGGMYVAFRNERGGESVIFSDQTDQRLYRQDLRGGRRGRAGALERAGRSHAGPTGGPRPPVRRRPRHPGRQAARDRARAARERRHGRQRPGDPAGRGAGRGRLANRPSRG